MNSLKELFHWNTENPKELKLKDGFILKTDYKGVSVEKDNTAEDLALKEMWAKIFNHNKQGQIEGINIKETANFLMNEYSFITIGEERKTIYRYENGVYLPDGNNFIATKVQEITTGYCLKNNIVNEIIGQIQRETHHDRSILETSLNKICLGNGIYNLNDRTLEDHDPKIIFIHKININYTPEAKCLEIDKFLRTILEPEYIPIIQEFLGFIIYRKYLIKKAIILIGERDTGKTTLINLIVKLIGEENTSGESLHRLLTDKFSAVNLYGKLLNFYDDLSFKDINDTGSFKIVTGGGWLSGEKKFGDRFQFQNYAKLLFACNKISAIKDNDDLAYYDRWIPIPFEHQFQNSEKDYNIFNKLTTKEELEGLLLWSLEGLHRLLEQKRFSDNRTAEDIKSFMEKYSDSVSVFCQEALIQEDGNWISKEELYKVYSNFTLEKKIGRVTKEKFGRDILSKLSYVHEGQKEYNGKKGVHGWINIKTTFTTFSELIIDDKNTNISPFFLACVSKNKVVKEVNNTENILSFEDIQSMLLDRKEMSFDELLSKGFTQDTLDKWLSEGLLISYKTDYVSLREGV